MTETPSSDTPVVDDPTKPNLSRAVKLVKDRRTGETRPAKKAGRPRKGSKRPVAATEGAESDEREVPEVTEADIKGAGFLGAVVWRMAGTFTGNRALTSDETQQLGEALAPVLAKWLPDLGEFAPEIALVVTVWGLYETTKVRKAIPDVDAFVDDPRLGSTVTLEGAEDAE